MSHGARPYVSIPEGHGLSLIESGDIGADLQRLIDEGGADVHVLAAVFIRFEEYAALQELLGILSFADIAYQFVIFGDEEAAGDLRFESLREISEFRHDPLSEKEFMFIARKTLAVLNDLFINRSLQEEYLAKLVDTKKDQDDLINIGRALAIEKDQGKLLRLILFLSKRITGADAGSIYLVELDEEGNRRLRFKYSHTFSRDIPLEERVLPMNKKSIAGYVAVTGEVLNIPDAYELPEDAPYSYNSSVDEKHKYRCRSMLVVPMKNHADEIIGVIQLINSKEVPAEAVQGHDLAFTLRLQDPADFVRHVVTFDQKYNSLLEAVAGQAAIAIENNRMITQIQNQFEEFVKASVSAIESRDPATSGHSFRVAELCVAMARAVNEVREGYLGGVTFTDVQIRELELAALLHDFGKVYIDLSVFRKAKKLYPKDYENLCLRLDYLYRFLELSYSVREAQLLRSGAAADCEALAEEKSSKLRRIVEIKEKIGRLNEPAVTDDDPEATLSRIASEVEEIECLGVDGGKVCVLSPQDRVNLSIRRGSLNPVERREIESHVTHTHYFVSKIPWPPEYRNIPEIALRHHEKLDGSGYPDGLRGRESTLVQSRIMAIADIFDALAAGDRPYKKAVPLGRTLEILREEADRGVLDPDLVALFIDGKLYEEARRDRGDAVAEEHAG